MPAHRRDQRDLRREQASCLQHRPVRTLHRQHERRVESVLHVELADHGGLPQHLQRPLHALYTPREHDAPGLVHRRHRSLLCRICRHNRALHLRPGRAQSHHHAIREVGIFDTLGARANELQTALYRHHSGDNGCGVFAQTVAQHEGGPVAARYPLLREAVLERDQRGLCEARVQQQLHCLPLHLRARVQNGRDRNAQEGLRSGVAAVHRTAERHAAEVQIAPHVYGQRALPRELPHGGV
mmetsp:Transcript_30072/g.67308  ORF Transcript_30072/g.67308 Transcript_30072/m.67308 type:complete len:240 (-) Transcript_30072:590-1309(-)